MTRTRVVGVDTTSVSEHDSDRRGMRIGSATLLAGGLIFLLGVSRPVVRDWAERWDDEAARIAVAEADPGDFRFGFVTMGVGFVVMGLGTGLLLAYMAKLATGRRASIAGAGAVVAVAGGLTLGLGRAITALVDLEAAAVDGAWHGVIGTIGLSLGFIVCGVLSWRGPFPRLAAVPFAGAGLVAAPTIPAVYMFGAIAFGVFGVIYLRKVGDIALG